MFLNKGSTQYVSRRQDIYPSDYNSFLFYFSETNDQISVELCGNVQYREEMRISFFVVSLIIQSRVIAPDYLCIM